MARQIGRMGGNAVCGQIGGCGAYYMADRAQPPCYQGRIIQLLAHAKRQVDPFLDQIDDPIVQRQIDLDPG